MVHGKRRKCTPCPFQGCDKVFNRPDRLEKHKRVHTGEKPFACDVDGCGRSYARSEHLKRHTETAHSEKPSAETFSCSEEGCEKSFAYEQNLRRHLVTAHGDNQHYLCPEEGCFRAFQKRHQLRAHAFEHQGVLPFQCHVAGCGRRFTQRSHLKRHEKTHAGYQCDATGCAETFATWTALHKHKTVEHRPPEKCSLCDKMVAAGYMTRHMRSSHSDGDSREFSCPREGCTRLYTTSYSLNQHIRYYHEDRGFECDFCGKKLSSKQKLRHHLATKHDPEHKEKEKYPVRKNLPRDGSGMAEKLAIAITGKKPARAPECCVLPSHSEAQGTAQESQPYSSGAGESRKRPATCTATSATGSADPGDANRDWAESGVTCSNERRNDEDNLTFCVELLEPSCQDPIESPSDVLEIMVLPGRDTEGQSEDDMQIGNVTTSEANVPLNDAPVVGNPFESCTMDETEMSGKELEGDVVNLDGQSELKIVQTAAEREVQWSEI